MPLKTKPFNHLNIPTTGTFIPKKRNLPEPEISDIILSAQDQQTVNELLAGKVQNKFYKKQILSRVTKDKLLKDIFGGLCIVCQDIPHYKLTYKLESITVIERVCKKHLKGDKPA